MEVFRTVETLQAYLESERKAGHGIGFVPTMGALHSGHTSLVKRAARENKCVVVSVFVNPTQFNDAKDLEHYPRTEREDLELLSAAGVSAVFAPSVEAVYPEPDTRNFDFGSIEQVMEGASRPGHFNGVAQVVSRLFDIVRPEKAYFGEKDFQQLAIIRVMVKNLGLDSIQIVGCPIVRGEDGLALSSRNARLDDQHRTAAPHIYRTIKSVARAISASNETIECAPLIEKAIIEMNSNPLIVNEYIQIVDPQTLQPLETIKPGQSARICTAVACHPVRLIDNVGATCSANKIEQLMKNLEPCK